MVALSQHAEKPLPPAVESSLPPSPESGNQDENLPVPDSQDIEINEGLQNIDLSGMNSSQVWLLIKKEG